MSAGTHENTGYLHGLRQYEIEIALQSFPSLEGKEGGRVLEIGAGTGHQARFLTERGFRVTAVDVASSAYRGCRVFPVIEYDGNTLPVDSGEIDIAFSSNVLEHVEKIDDFLDEIGRAVAHGGYAIHILPTPAWRFWTILGHYGWLLKRLFHYLFIRRSCVKRNTNSPKAPKSWRDVGRLMVPFRHGERGIALTELYYYSRHWWVQRFEGHGFHVISSYPTGLFYSGACVFGEHLSIDCRRRLANWLGSACRIYVLRHR